MKNKRKIIDRKGCNMRIVIEEDGWTKIVDNCKKEIILGFYPSRRFDIIEDAIEFLEENTKEEEFCLSKKIHSNCEYRDDEYNWGKNNKMIIATDVRRFIKNLKTKTQYIKDGRTDGLVSIRSVLKTIDRLAGDRLI